MDRTAFLVLGMHRSGTSATTRLVNLAGAAISGRLMPPLSDNPKGFWESLSIAELHDQALATLGMAWDSIERVPDSWFESPAADVLRSGLRHHLQTSFPDGESFVIKDPRACRFLPAWLPIVEEAGYRAVAIMPVRNPLEVARSLERRNAFPLSKSLLLWLRHVVDAEVGSRSLPLAIVRYAELIQNWRPELAEANRQLGFACFPSSVLFDEQVGRFLSREMRHHVASDAELAEADVRGWATEAFIALQQLHGPADQATSEAARRTLDRLRRLLDDAESVLDPFLAAYRARVQAAVTTQAATEARLVAAESGAAEISKVLERRSAELEAAARQLEEQHAATTQAMEAAARQLEEQQAATARAVEAVASERAVRAAVEQELSVAGARSIALEESLTRTREESARVCAELERRVIAADDFGRRRDRAWVEAEAEVARLAALAAARDADREHERRAFDESARDLLRKAAQGRASIQRSLVNRPGRLHALRCLLADAGVGPSRWTRAPLRSARGLMRLGGRAYRRRVTTLARSGLFDPTYYSRTIGGVPANLPARFLLGGDLAGERAHVLFDPEWYRQNNPDLPPDVPPLAHYLTAGGWELRAPHPLFDPAFYLSQWTPGEVTGITPLSHFIEIGGPAGVSPHPLFDAFHYLRLRPDVAAAGLNPLQHYLLAPPDGAGDPHPLFANQYYLARNPDVTGLSALEHFVRHGAAEGRSPHPLFDVGHYWHQRPDVRAAGVNPLRHYLESGSAQGVDPHPLFESRYYESQFAAPWNPRVNPLVHYLRWGWRDSRNPHPDFDARRYLDTYPDVAASGIDPLVHYVLGGAAEGRQPIRPTPARAGSAGHGLV